MWLLIHAEIKVINRSNGPCFHDGASCMPYPYSRYCKQRDQPSHGFAAQMNSKFLSWARVKCSISGWSARWGQTRWSQFCRRYFQMQFFQWKLWYLALNFCYFFHLTINHYLNQWWPVSLWHICVSRWQSWGWGKFWPFSHPKGTSVRPVWVPTVRISHYIRCMYWVLSKGQEGRQPQPVHLMWG